MTDKTSLGDRMKTYERAGQQHLLPRSPVIIRVDGKAFHTFCKRVEKTDDPSLKTGPFSQKLHDVMMNTAFAMCEQMQNATVAYTQSDEISILLRDWDKFETQQWFGGNLQKIVSVSGAMAAAYFNYFLQKFFKYDEEGHISYVTPQHVHAVPLFDARVFNLPREEVTNYFIWRQKDAARNSINMLARFYFSHKELHGKNVSQVQEMLFQEHGVNWNNISTWQKRGACIIYKSSWAKDDEIPVFTQDRDYIERQLVPSPEKDEEQFKSTETRRNLKSCEEREKRLQEPSQKRSRRVAPTTQRSFLRSDESNRKSNCNGSSIRNRSDKYCCRNHGFPSGN